MIDKKVKFTVSYGQNNSLLKVEEVFYVKEKDDVCIFRVDLSTRGFEFAGQGYSGMIESNVVHLRSVEGYGGLEKDNLELLEIYFPDYNLEWQLFGYMKDKDSLYLTFITGY